MNKLKTIALVSFFTVLIWAFAEGESLQTKRTEAEVMFPSQVADGWSVRVAEGQAWRGWVELAVEGPTASVDGLESVLRQSLSITPGMEGLPRASGEYAVDLRQALRGLPAFRTRGISVLSVDPPTVRVVVDELTLVSLPVVVDAPAGELAAPAQVVGPAEASVRMPTRVAESLPSGAGLFARVRPEALASLREGVRSTVQARVEPDEALSAAAGSELLGIDPAQVDVQLTVRSKTASVVVQRMTVDIRGQLDELSEWEITMDPPDLKDVRVTGPSELTEKLGPGGGLSLRPFVWVAYDELREGTLTKTVEFSDYTGYPQALNLRFEVESPEVVLTIRRRSPAGQGAEAQPPG